MLRMRPGPGLLVFSLAIIGLIGATCSPAIEIQTPSLGMFTTDPELVLRGTVASGEPDLVTIDGEPATVISADGWELAVPLDPEEAFPHWKIEDGKGHQRIMTVATGEGMADGIHAPAGLVFRFNEVGLRALALGIEQSGLLNLEGLLLHRKVGDLDIEDAYSNWNTLDILGTKTGRVRFKASLFDPQINAEVDAGFENCDVTIEADRLTIKIDVELKADSNGEVWAQTKEVHTNFVNFDADVDNCTVSVVVDFLELVTDLDHTIQDAVQDELEGYLDEDLISGYFTDLTRVLAPLGLEIDAPLFKGREENDGFSLVHDIAISAPAIAEYAPDLGESLVVSEVEPDFDALTPVSDAPYGMAVSFSATALNQLLRAEIENGLLNEFRVLYDPAAPDPVFESLLPALGHDPADPLVLQIDPRLAPMVGAGPGPNGELLHVDVGHLLLHFGDPLTATRHFDAALYFPAGLDLDPSEDGREITPRLSLPSPQSLETRIFGNHTPTDDATLESVVRIFTGVFLDEISEAIGSLTLPTFKVRDGGVVAQFSLATVAVERQGDYPAVFLDPVVELCRNAAGDVRTDAVERECYHDEDHDGLPRDQLPVRVRVCPEAPHCPQSWKRVSDPATAIFDCDDLDAGVGGGGC